MIEILEPGAQTTVQDGGRPGHLAAGITVAGAQDYLALRLANLLVGNAPTPPPFSLGPRGDAGLECLLAGPKMRFTDEAVIAVTGAEVRLEINSRPAPTWTAHYVEPGSVVAIGPARVGVRSYVAIAGGIRVPEVLGSRSTHLFAGRGGVAGRPLRRGDQLPTVAPSAGHFERVGATVNEQLREQLRPAFADVVRIRVVLGPQDELFTDQSVEDFLGEEWTLSPVADRMGFRFTGPRLYFKERPPYLLRDAGPDPSNIVDDVIPVGGIQVPSGLEAIVMGVENPTVGGFAKIATVITPDICRVGQLRPGQRVMFTAVHPEEAVIASLRVLETCSEDAIDNLSSSLHKATSLFGG